MSDSHVDYKHLQEDTSDHQRSHFGDAGGSPPPYNPSYGFAQTSSAYGVPLQPTQPQVVNVMTHQFSQGPSSFGLNPMRIQCPNCQQSIMTNVTRRVASKTHAWAFGLFICLCWLCCCIPYCCASCKDAYHSCPNCGTDLGIYRT